MRNYTTYVGMDVHARSIQASAVVPETGEVFNRSFAGCPQAADVAEWLAALPQTTSYVPVVCGNGPRAHGRIFADTMKGERRAKGRKRGAPMPGIATHHIFGTDVYGECPQLIGEEQAVRDAFLLGNQGPDPFFYLKALPNDRQLRKLGQIMHKKRTPQLLFALHEHLVSAVQTPNRAACRAYALGFVCHYLLDSTVHPLVYAQQHAICDSGIKGLTEVWSHRVVHATIETSLDECLLTSRLGATAATFPPHKTMLRCPASALVDISKRYASALGETYDQSIPEMTFATAVNLNRLAQRVLDSKSAGLRQRFDYLAGAGMISAYLLALSHRGELLRQTPFANDDHATWEVPFSDGTTISASFDGLYSQAQERALQVLPAFAEPGFGLRDCEALVGNVNFLGRPVEA